MAVNESDPRIEGNGADRRRVHPVTPENYIDSLPSTLLLDRLPIPVLALHENGRIVRTNTAFEEMLGYSHAELNDLPFDRIFIGANDVPSAARLRAQAGKIVELLHEDGTKVKALASKSALVRDDDPVVLVAFYDVTDQLWTHSQLASEPGWTD